LSHFIYLHRGGPFELGIHPFLLLFMFWMKSSLKGYHSFALIMTI